MIELICLDVDGTLSDGSLYYSDSGEAMKKFSVKDGLILAYWQSIGKKSAIITGRKSKIVEYRANELKIDFVFTGISDKGKCVRDLQSRLNLSAQNCACIGDDMNDIAMFRECGLTFAPNNAADELKNIAKIKLSKNGGDGAVREMVEFILKQEGLYEKFIEHWK